MTGIHIVVDLPSKVTGQGVSAAKIRCRKDPKVPLVRSEDFGE